MKSPWDQARQLSASVLYSHACLPRPVRVGRSDLQGRNETIAVNSTHTMTVLTLTPESENRLNKRRFPMMTNHQIVTER